MGRPDFHGISDQRRAAFKRLRDAEALYAVKLTRQSERLRGFHARGAMYLAGYAVECKLKAIAMEVYRCRTLAQLAEKLKIDEQEVYTHGLEGLAKRLPMWPNLRRGKIWEDFSKVVLWRPSWRYDPEDWMNLKAATFLRAVRNVYDWLERQY
jgi:hypothetical protein